MFLKQRDIEIKNAQTLTVFIFSGFISVEERGRAMVQPRIGQKKTRAQKARTARKHAGRTRRARDAELQSQQQSGAEKRQAAVEARQLLKAERDMRREVERLRRESKPRVDPKSASKSWFPAVGETQSSTAQIVLGTIGLLVVMLGLSAMLWLLVQ